MKLKKIRVGIATEIVILIVSSILLFAGITCYVGHNIFSETLKYQMEAIIESTCVAANYGINGDYVEEYLETEGASSHSKETLNWLQSICDSVEFNYIYIIQPDFENKRIINSLSVHGSMYPELEVYDVGQISKITSDDYDFSYRQIMEGKSNIEFVYRIDTDFADRNKAHITGLKPITNSNGEIVGIICAEATYSWIIEYLHYYLTSFIKWLVVIVIAIVIICSLLIHYRVVIPFIKITKETERFASQNTLPQKELSAKIARNNELGELATSIDLMEKQTIENIDNITRMTVEKERLGTELDIATKIQVSALPHTFPAFPERNEFDLFASMDPAKEVGGDFYDFFLIDEDHLAVVIADVSGKGIPAALFMMESKIMIEDYSALSMDPADILENVNNRLCENNAAEMFVTTWLGILEISTGKLKTANGGHEDPAIMKAGGNFELCKEKHGFVLGGMENMKYKIQEYDLNSGDTVFVYTDGVPEATNMNNELFGTERMIAALNENKAEKDLEILTANLRKSVDIFVGDAPQFDDLTLLVLKYNGISKE